MEALEAAVAQERKLKAATRRKVAVRANVDPRTVDAVWRGEAICNDPRERARNVMLEMGMQPPAPKDE